MINITTIYWLSYWLCLGIIWAWYGELEYFHFNQHNRTNLCSHVSMGINILLMPIAIWFGFFAYLWKPYTDIAGRVDRRYRLRVNFINNAKMDIDDDQIANMVWCSISRTWSDRSPHSENHHANECGCYRMRGNPFGATNYINTYRILTILVPLESPFIR